VRRLYRFEYAGDPNQRSVTAADDAHSRTEEAIHQVRVFAAARRQAYEALTVEAQFDKVVQLSGVMKVASGWQEHYWDPLAKLLV
jgi:hypothetical protein